VSVVVGCDKGSEEEGEVIGCLLCLSTLCVSLTRSIVKAQFKAQRNQIPREISKVKVAPVTGYLSCSPTLEELYTEPYILIRNASQSRVIHRIP
jgi:hypothetical protein